MKRWDPLALIGPWLMSSPGRAHSQRPSDGFVRWSTAHAIPVRTAGADSTTSDLLPLRSLVLLTATRSVHTFRDSEGAADWPLQNIMVAR